MRLHLIWLCAIVGACSGNPIGPTAGGGGVGNSGERVTAFGAPPTSEIGPGHGTGTLVPPDANSCSTAIPTLDANSGNGKVELEHGVLGPLAKGVTFEVFRGGIFVARYVSSRDDSSGGRRAQWKTIHDPRVRPKDGELGPGTYTARSREDRRGCGVLDQGRWSSTAFSVTDSHPQDAGIVQADPSL